MEDWIIYGMSALAFAAFVALLVSAHAAKKAEQRAARLWDNATKRLDAAPSQRPAAPGGSLPRGGTGTELRSEAITAAQRAKRRTTAQTQRRRDDSDNLLLGGVIGYAIASSQAPDSAPSQHDATSNVDGGGDTSCDSGSCDAGDCGSE